MGVVCHSEGGESSIVSPLKRELSCAVLMLMPARSSHTGAQRASHRVPASCRRSEGVAAEANKATCNCSVCRSEN